MSEKRQRDLPLLPSSWNWRTVGELTVVIRGASPRPKGDPRYFGGPIPWISISDLTRQPGKYLHSTREGVTEAGAALSRLIPAGDLILSNSATVCVPKILKVDGCIHDGFVAFPTLKEKVDLDFAYYWFEFVRPQIIQENRQGITQVNLNTGIVREMHFPFAPRKEQRRIVMEIEKQFTRLEAGVAALRRVQANLTRYRAAVLKAACEGKLVPTEAELHRQRKTKFAKLETGAELLTRILAERRKSWTGRGKYKEPAAPDTTSLPPLPEGWTWASVAQLCFLDVGFAFKSAEFAKSGIRLLRGENLEPGRMRWTDTRFWPETNLEDFKHLLIREGEIVLAMDRPLISSGLKIARARPDDLPCLLVQRMARFRPVMKTMTSFLFTALNTHGFIRHLLGGQTGTQLPHISGEGIQSFPIALPPLLEQTRIVAEVERRLSVVEELESVVSANLQRAARLRQSILQKAFTGGLVS